MTNKKLDIITNNAVNWSKPKDYAREYRMEYIIYWCLFVIFGCVAVYIAQEGLTYLIKDKLLNTLIIRIASIIILILIYLLHFLNISQFIRRLKLDTQLKISTNIIILILVSIINISSVLFGVVILTKNNSNHTNIAENITNDSLLIVNQYDTLINQTDNLIKEIQQNSKNQWLGLLSSQDKELISKYITQKLELIKEKEVSINELEVKKTNLLEVENDFINVTIWYKAIFTIILEFFIILSIRSITIYKVNIYQQVMSVEPIELLN